MTVRVNGSASAEGFNAQAEFQDEKLTGGGDNYTYSVRARKISGEGGFVIHFAEQHDAMPDLAWFIGVRHRAHTAGLAAVAIRKRSTEPVGVRIFGTCSGNRLEPSIRTDGMRRKIEVDGRHVHCYLDGKEIHNVQLPESLGPSLYAAAGRAASGDIFIRLINTSPIKQNVYINLAGDRVADTWRIRPPRSCMPTTSMRRIHWRSPQKYLHTNIHCRTLEVNFDMKQKETRLRF